MKKSTKAAQGAHSGASARRHSILAAAIAFLGIASPSATQAADWAWITDPADMDDTSGDIRSVSAHVLGDSLVLTMTVQGVAAPSVEQTPEGMVNRYYYHWLLDTDNNPATGRSTAEYEGVPTGVTSPIGYERAIQVGWRDGKPNGIQVYDPADDEVLLLQDFAYTASGNTLTAVIPLSDLGLTPGQTIGVSAFQEGASNDWATDWMESATLTLEGLSPAYARVTDPADMDDSSGDIRAITAYTLGDNLYLSMTIHGVAAPSLEQTPEGMVNRYYYHWLLDIDNNPATGRSTAEYEGVPTGVTSPIGYERAIQVGWRDGKPNGIQVYDPADDEVLLLQDFEYQASGNTILAVIPLADLGLTPGQTIGISAFQEGASNDWATDWMESATLTLEGPAAELARATDPSDLEDSSGDIRAFSARVLGENLVLSLTVQGVAAPSVAQTAEGMVNRYYYHWLLDTDNNPATGRSNAEYEGVPTGIENPVGYELAVLIGWRDGKPNGVEVYNPADEDNPILFDFPFQASGNTVTAIIPLSSIGLSVGQTITVAAFQEGASNDWATDWTESDSLTLEAPASGRMKIDGDFSDWTAAAAAGAVYGVDDPKDMADPSGDFRRIEATVENGYLYLRIVVDGVALPSIDDTPEGMVNRYYYHWLIDIDNNPATGRSTAEYENEPTGVQNPIGYERAVQIGWRNGEPDGVNVYDPVDDDVYFVEDFEFAASGNSVEARIKLSDIGLAIGQTIGFSAFQEGQSDGWATDWLESVEFTLEESGTTGLSIPSQFTGDPTGFTILLEDDGELQADPDSAEATLDGQPIAITATKANGVTTIRGSAPALLESGSSHTVRLKVDVAGVTESREFVLIVAPYSVLPTAGMLRTVNTQNRGFVVKPTQLSSEQTWVTGTTGPRHQDKADLAEAQLSGSLAEEDGYIFYNEVNPGNLDAWLVESMVEEGVINWFEPAPGVDASLNFPNDAPIPGISEHSVSWGVPAEGVVVEILTYLELEAGYHKLGLYSEGGHKVTAGFSTNAPVLSLFDDSETERVPTYYGRSQFFDIVAPETGYYPIRYLWFQSVQGEEPGMMLELFSVENRQLVLLNDSNNPASIRAYRAGVLTDPNFEEPLISVTRSGANLRIEWTGVLEVSESVSGPYQPYPGAPQSPLEIPTTAAPAAFLRARAP